MKVAWVQSADENYHELVKVGEKIGFDIIGVLPGDNKLHLIYDADLIIICNLKGYKPDQLLNIKYALFEIKIPYITIIKDNYELIRPGFALSLYTHSSCNIFINSEVCTEFHKKLEIDSVLFPLETEKHFYDFWRCIDKSLKKVKKIINE